MALDLLDLYTVDKTDDWTKYEPEITGNIEENSPKEWANPELESTPVIQDEVSKPETETTESETTEPKTETTEPEAENITKEDNKEAVENKTEWEEWMVGEESEKGWENEDEDFDKILEDIGNLAEDIKAWEVDNDNELAKKLIEIENQLMEYKIKDELKENKLQELLKENEGLKDELLYYKSSGSVYEDPEVHDIAKIISKAKKWDEKYKKLAVEKLQEVLEELWWTVNNIKEEILENDNIEWGNLAPDNTTKKENNEEQKMIDTYWIDIDNIWWS